MSKNLRLILFLVGLIILAVVISVLGSQDKNKPAANNARQTNQATSNSQTSSQQNQPPTAQQIADSISVQSTGAKFSADKSEVTYSFKLNNTLPFTGSVVVALGGPYGSLGSALTFNESNLQAGAGDTGKAVWSNHYTTYSYQITVDGQTFTNPGGRIPAIK